MKPRYWWIVITYIVMQFSSLIGVPILLKAGIYSNLMTASIHWTIFSFFAAFLLTLIFLRKDFQERHLIKERASAPATTGWVIGGFFLAIFSQAITSQIEIHFFNITQQSENTSHLLEIAKQAPIFIIVISVLGPFLEEIVFRYILFGSLYHRFNFFISGFISSLIFAFVHMDFPHTLTYTAMGFVFAFLYVKTKRIIVPILAHTFMNSFVVIINLYLLPILQDLEKLTGFVGRFFS